MSTTTTTRPERPTLLRKIREERGQSLRSLARDLGCQPRYLSEIERGLRWGSHDFHSRLEREFRMSAAMLLLPVEEIEPDD